MSEKLSSRLSEVIIRPMPKVIFFYPIWIASLLCMLLPSRELAGQFWFGIFALNVLVVAADFSEEKSLIAVLSLVAAVLAALWLGVLNPIIQSLGDVKPVMNNQFYACVFGLFTIIYVFVFIYTRFNYWVFRPTEVVHRSGVFPTFKRYSTESMRIQKEIPDVLERLMAGAGRFVMITPMESHPILLEHVLGIGYKDEHIASLLGIRRVEIEEGPKPRPV